MGRDETPSLSGTFWQLEDNFHFTKSKQMNVDW